MKPLAKTVFSFLAATLIASPELLAVSYNPKGYQAAELGNNVLLNTPMGSKVFYGDLGFKNFKSYLFSIPLADLKNKEDPASPSPPLSKGEESSYEESNLIAAANKLYHKGKLTESLRYVDEALKRNKESARAWTMKGSLLHAQGRKEDAKKAWEEAARLQPENKEIKSILETY